MGIHSVFARFENDALYFRLNLLPSDQLTRRCCCRRLGSMLIIFSSFTRFPIHPSIPATLFVSCFHLYHRSSNIGSNARPVITHPLPKRIINRVVRQTIDPSHPSIRRPVLEIDRSPSHAIIPRKITHVRLQHQQYQQQYPEPTTTRATCFIQFQTPHNSRRCKPLGAIPFFLFAL